MNPFEQIFKCVGDRFPATIPTLPVRFFAFLILAAILLLIYNNSLHSSWHLDDRPNIVNNYYLHLDSLHQDKIVKTFFTDPHNPEQLNEKLYRPVACFTFAMNWYFGQDNVFGYHVVNTLIHILTAFFLFLFILNLFETPNLKNKYLGNPVVIAFLASILWAANPIQTQAVTYIVQRMAQLAALFYILGLCAYLKGRSSNSIKKRILWFVFCMASYLLAVNSKPNAIIMPLSVMLIEISFFQNLADKQVRKNNFIAVSVLAGLLFLLCSLVFFNGNPSSFLDWYHTRTFTLTERLLAQPRVILFYLSQIFFPVPSRLSIAHDIILSSSLFRPWTTIPSILIIFFLIVFSVLQIRKKPILSFSILFFFLNHVIESSILAFEIIFEHRNYLPSFFLFLPIACLLDYLLITYKRKNITLYGLTIFFIIALVALFGTSTIIRNQAWKNDITLWSDAISKAPNDARASNIIAIKLAWGDNSTHPNRYDMALKLFEDSLEKHFPSSYVEADIYGNMALIYFHQKNEPEKAFGHFKNALEIHPENLKIRRDFVNALTIQRQFEEALEHVDILLKRNSTNGIYQNLKGHILLWQGKYEPALACFEKAFERLSDKSSVVLNFSIALNLAGHHERAEVLLQEAIKIYPKDITFYFAIIENSIQAGKNSKATGYIKEMVQQFDRHEIEHGLEYYTDNPRYAPISKMVIAPAISDVYESGDIN